MLDKRLKPPFQSNIITILHNLHFDKRMPIVRNAYASGFQIMSYFMLNMDLGEHTNFFKIEDINTDMDQIYYI